MSDLRDTGDSWVTAADGNRYWGKYGAAGLIAHDPSRGILLQHRVSWSDHGGTWGIPGGALHSLETAIDGAFREAHEEANVPLLGVTPLFTHVLDRDGWKYTTVIAHVAQPFEAVITDAESHELRWVSVADVASYPLHPAFAASWKLLLPLLDQQTTLVIDTANVVGAVPNGWWRDRLGASHQLLERLALLHKNGAPTSLFRLSPETEAVTDQVFAKIIMVVEGQARHLQPHAGISVISTSTNGDDAIVSVAETELRTGHNVTVVTSDRDLQTRVSAIGAHTLPVKSLHAALHAIEKRTENLHS